VFFHRQGEIRDRTFENESFRASGLSLIAIAHRNTVYLDRAVRRLRRERRFPTICWAMSPPLGWEHIDLTGDYPATAFRPLREVRSCDPWIASGLLCDGETKNRTFVRWLDLSDTGGSTLVRASLRMSTRPSS
jgi:hypothetical protein